MNEIIYVDAHVCRHLHLQSLLSCPTASIHTEKPAKDILQVQNMFPLPIDDSLPVCDAIALPPQL